MSSQANSKHASGQLRGGLSKLGGGATSSSIGGQVQMQVRKDNLPHLNNILFLQWQSKHLGHMCSSLTQILILYSYASLPCQHVHILPISPYSLVLDIVNTQTRIICIELHLPHSPLPFAIGREELLLLSKLSSLLRSPLKYCLRQTWRHCYGATPAYRLCWPPALVS